jgi:hypothetical protein
LKRGRKKRMGLLYTFPRRLFWWRWQPKLSKLSKHFFFDPVRVLSDTPHIGIFVEFSWSRAQRAISYHQYQLGFAAQGIRYLNIGLGTDNAYSKPDFLDQYNSEETGAGIQHWGP